MRKTPDMIIAHKGAAFSPLVCLTAYTAPMAAAMEKHCDLLLVGDSLAMVIYGHETTRQATMDMMATHGEAVTRATKTACVIVDMPFGSYEQSDDQALENARRLMERSGAQGVKLEGGSAMASRIRAITKNGIPVLAHIGLLPQSVQTPDGYKVQGRDEEGAHQILDDAQAVAQAGSFAVVLEAIPPDLAAEITNSVPVPTIGIGAGIECDGQILVGEDMLGLTPGRKPKFVKTYASLAEQVGSAAATYAAEVRNRSFPSQDQTYKPSAILFKKAS